MLPIYICEDNPEIRIRYVELISEYIAREKTDDLKIAYATGNPYSLLDNLELRPQQSMYLLDIHLGAPMNGIQLAGEIRKYDPRAYIVIVSALPERLMFHHQTEAMDCISKLSPNMDKLIFKCLDNARILHQRFLNNFEERKVRLMIDKVYIPFPLRDVRYITSAGLSAHEIEIRTDLERYRYRGALDGLLPRLDYAFRRCHKSYIVNLRHVEQIRADQRALLLDNRDSIPVSRRSVKEIKQYLQLLES